MKRHFASIVGFIILTTAPAIAQQSPQNAKEFLKKSLAGSRFNENYYTTDGRPDDKSGYEVDSGWVGNLTSPVENTELCTIVFSYNRPRVETSNNGYYDADYDNRNINFKTIVEAKASGQKVLIYRQGRVFPSVLFAPSESMATRIAFAMEYLKSHCNETDNLGF